MAATLPPDPTRDDLKISARILLHLARQPRFGADETPPEALTQAGLAATLRTSQASVAHALSRLVAGSLLEVRKGRVAGRRQKVLVYQVTEEGRRLAEHIRSRMAESVGVGGGRPPPLLRAERFHASP